MSTSGGGGLNALLYVAVIVAGVRTGLRSRGTDLEDVLRRPPPAALALWAVVAIPSLLQVPFPALLTHLQRDPDRIADGELWRLVTSAVTQDGGVFGTVVNLVALGVVAPVAVAVLGGLRTWVVFTVAVVAFDLAVITWSPTVGAGNSAATLALAAAVVSVVATRRRLVPVAAVLACGAALLLLRDAHGEAVLGGLVLGAVAAQSRASTVR